MKAVLISIHPQWCERIALCDKTLEVRKTRPKVEIPFRCYIYQTKKKWLYKLLAPLKHFAWVETVIFGRGKVIGEFICDRVYQYSTADHLDGVDISEEDAIRMSCLTKKELEAYEFSAEQKDFCLYMIGLYCWHISNLKIYEKPKKLSNFTGIKTMRDGFELRVLDRPPQSWCYVMEVNCNG